MRSHEGRWEKGEGRAKRRAGGATSPEFWMNLQKLYGPRRAENKLAGTAVTDSQPQPT